MMMIIEASSSRLEAAITRAIRLLFSPTSVAHELHSSGGWLSLVGTIGSEVLSRTGTCVSGGRGSEESEEESSAYVAIDRTKLSCLLRMVLQKASHLSYADDDWLPSVTSLAIIAYVSPCLSMIAETSHSNCDVGELLAVVRDSCLQSPMLEHRLHHHQHQEHHQHAFDLSAGVCSDLLIYFAQHGRRTVPHTAAAQTKLNSFIEGLMQLTLSHFESSVSCMRGERGESAALRVLQASRAVSTVLYDIVVGKDRPSVRRKASRSNDSSTGVLRFDLWFDGSLRLLSLVLSHVHSWGGERLGRVASKSREEAADARRETTVEEILQCALFTLERFVTVSSVCSLPNLNTSVGLLTTLMNLVMSVLLQSDLHSNRDASGRCGIVRTSCYHQFNRILFSIASAAVLEKHVHFIACTVVEALSRCASIPKRFQDISFPGVFGLFERCAARQKTQMFAMLDARSRLLMTDLHAEFLRSFKFTGK